MKLENGIGIKTILPIQSILIAFIALLFLRPISYSYAFVGVVGLIIIVLFIYKYPNFVILLFIISMFWGQLYYRNAEIGVTISDIVFLFVLIGYMSTYFNPRISHPKKNAVDKSIVISFAILIAFELLSLIVNAILLPNNYLIYGGIKCIYMIQYLAVFSIFNSLRFSDNGNFFLKLIYLLSILQLPFVVYQMFFIKETTGIDINRDIIGTMSYHHGMLGTFMLIPFFLAIGEAKTASKQIYRIGSICLAGVFLILVIISNTRSALLGLVISVGIFLFLNFRFKLNNLKYFTVIIITAIVIYFFTPVNSLVQATVKNGNTVDISSYGRLLIWDSAWNFFIHTDILHKIFGVGFGCFFLIPQKCVVFDGLRHSFGAHNNFLNVLCETGVAGFIAFVAFFVIILKSLYKNKHPHSQSFFYATIAMLFSGLTQETFHVTTAFHNLWLFYMIILALVLKLSNAREF